MILLLTLNMMRVCHSSFYTVQEQNVEGIECLW